MANIRLGNSYYIDTQYSASEELAIKDIRVSHVVVTTTNTTAQLVLSDGGLGVKLNLKIAANDESQVFDFSDNPIRFSTSIRPTTLSDCVATCVLVLPGT